MIKKIFPIAFLMSIASGVAAQTTANVTDSTMLSGAWVPANASDIDYYKLPKFKKSEHVIVHDVRDQNGHRVNQHNYLVYFNNQYWAMWSDGPGVAREAAGQHGNRNPGHDNAHQKVSYAVSKDGLKWEKSKDITNTPSGDSGWIARGFWVYQGKLLALVSSYQAPGYQGAGLSLQAYEWNEKSKQWNHLGMVYDNTLNNFPPEQLPTGEWMMSRRDSLQNTFSLIGGVKSYNDWQSVPAVTYKRKDFKPEEPYWWVLPDNKQLVALYRDNAKSRRIFRAYSSDNGKTWSEAVKTNFPDATSKFCALRLSDGRYVFVSNPNPTKRDPMTIAVSNDGIHFNKMIWLIGDRTIDYPHVIENNGYLFIAFSGAKQSVELIRVKISELDEIKMPSTAISK